nr:MAG TPA: Mucin-1-catalytic proteolysis, STRUCTURAL PROTEIN [Caudoviricetes sp.]
MHHHIFYFLLYFLYNLIFELSLLYPFQHLFV